MLFDLDAATQIDCTLYELTGVKFESRQAANPYFPARIGSSGASVREFVKLP